MTSTTDRNQEIVDALKRQIIRTGESINKIENEIKQARDSHSEWLYVNDKDPNEAYEKDTEHIHELNGDLAFHKTIKLMLDTMLNVSEKISQ